MKFCLPSCVFKFMAVSFACQAVYSNLWLCHSLAKLCIQIHGCHSLAKLCIQIYGCFIRLPSCVFKFMAVSFACQAVYSNLWLCHSLAKLCIQIYGCHSLAKLFIQINGCVIRLPSCVFKLMAVSFACQAVYSNLWLCHSLAKLCIQIDGCVIRLPSCVFKFMAVSFACQAVYSNLWLCQTKQYHLPLAGLDINTISFTDLTLNVWGPSYLGLNRSISWLLMPWLLT